MSFKLGLYTYLAASIRQVVDVPVIAFGRIVDPLQADKVLAAGEAGSGHHESRPDRRPASAEQGAGRPAGRLFASAWGTTRAASTASTRVAG